MVPMLKRAVESYRVPVASSSGFDSLTVKHDLFRDALGRYEDYGQPTILLHLGDHDPSGVSVYESMAEDLSAFCEDSEEADDGLIELRRVALTPEQIADFGFATTPDEIKPTDSRSRSFLARGLAPAAQLEAIPPDTLSTVVRQSRRKHVRPGRSARKPGTGTARACRGAGEVGCGERSIARGLQARIAPLASLQSAH
jgi:hypothetical protein